MSELHLGSVSAAAMLGELAADRQRDGSFEGRGKCLSLRDCEYCLECKINVVSKYGTCCMTSNGHRSYVGA